MAITRTPLTAEALLRLPDDGQRHELIAGELRTMPPPGEEHGSIEALCTIALGQYVHAHRLGRVLSGEPGFLLASDPDTVRAPDVAFISRERAQAPLATGYRQGAPDLAVEIISPSDLYTEVAEKVATWLEHGTGMVIVINPRHRAVVVHRSATQVRHLTVDDTIDGEDVVPGWTLPVRELFAAGD